MFLISSCVLHNYSFGGLFTVRPPHTQVIIFHNEPPFHSCIYYNVIDDEYQKFELITSSSNSALSFIFTSELYHKAGNAKSPNLLLPTERKTPQNACRPRSKF